MQIFCIPTEDDKDTENQTHEPKAKTEYARKADEHGLTLDDYIDNINMEADIETVKVYFERWLKLCTTEKQSAFFTSVKDKRKKQLGF